MESGEGESLAVVVCVSRGAESARARVAVGALATVEGAGDLGLAARVGGSPASVCSAEADARRSCSATRTREQGGLRLSHPSEPWCFAGEGESALGLPADRRRAQRARCRGLGDDRAKRAHRSGRAAGTDARGLVLASVLAPTGRNDVGLRLPDRRDRVPIATLRAVLHLARDTPGRVRGGYLEP